jgi:hypothetical protein
MKKIIIVLAILLPLRKLFAQSDTNKERKNILMISLPLHIIDNNNNESYLLFDLAFKVSYEYRVSKCFTPYFQLGFHGPLTFDLETKETQEKIMTNGLNLQFGNKFYFNSNKTPSGFYMSPQFTFNTIKLNEDGSIPGGYIKILDYGLTGIFGYQIVCSKGFAMCANTGAGVFRRNYFDNTMIENTTVTNHNETGIRPYLGLQFGYAF